MPIKMSCRSGIGVLRDLNGHLITDSLDQANRFNDFFASVFTVDNDVIPSVKSRSPENVSLNNIHFTAAGVLKVLKKMNVKSAGGPDFLLPFCLKTLLHQLLFL